MQRRHASAVGHAATFACVRDDIRMRDRPLPRGGAFFQEWRYVKLRGADDENPFQFARCGVTAVRLYQQQ
jgi:hypothetical protein